MLMLYHAGRYFMPRKWSSLAFFGVFVATGIIVFIVLPVQLRFFKSVINGVGSIGKHSSEELESLIPLDTYGKALLNTQKQHISQNSSQDDLAFSDIQCKPLNPNVMFFVRIPKCASTSFVDLLRTLSKQGEFEFFFHSSGAFDWDRLKMKQVANFAKAKKDKFVYARHFYYVDFRPFGLTDYTYVSIIRDPISRVKSSFLYYHYSSKQHIQAILDPNHRNETLLSCIEHHHEGCAHNWMTKYFCGHDRYCKLGNEQALEFAKENLNREFAVVMILEELDLSFKVLQKVLPHYFGQVDQSNFDLPVTNKNEKLMTLSQEETQAISRANTADQELYDYARERLYEQARACGLKDT